MRPRIFATPGAPRREDAVTYPRPSRNEQLAGFNGSKRILAIDGADCGAILAPGPLERIAAVDGAV